MEALLPKEPLPTKAITAFFELHYGKKVPLRVGNHPCTFGVLNRADAAHALKYKNTSAASSATGVPFLQAVCQYEEGSIAQSANGIAQQMH